MELFTLFSYYNGSLLRRQTADLRCLQSPFRYEYDHCERRQEQGTEEQGTVQLLRRLVSRSGRRFVSVQCLVAVLCTELEGWVAVTQPMLVFRQVICRGLRADVTWSDFPHLVSELQATTGSDT